MRAPCLFVLGFGFPALGLAQTAPRLYVGASAVLVNPAPFESYGSSRVGPAGTVGVQLSPRWALEAGVQATWRRDSYAYTFATGAPVYDTYAFTTRSTALLVPLLARYTFTAPAARLRVDALGGGYWGHSLARTQETIVSNGRLTQTDYRDAYNSCGLTLGPQLRYGLGARLEAKLNLPASVQVNDQGSFGNRLSLRPQLGVQYTLGQ